MHLNNKQALEYFRGDFDNFLKRSAEIRLSAKREYEAQQMRIQHLKDYINTYYTAKKSSAQNNMIGQVRTAQIASCVSC